MHDLKAQDLVRSNSTEKLEFLNKESLVVNTKLEQLRKEVNTDDKSLAQTILIANSDE